MSNPDNRETTTMKRASEIGLTAAKIFLVLAGIALFLNIIEVQIPKLLSEISDQIPGFLREVLLWLATNKTVEAINAIATEWSGLLTILGLVLAVVFYLLSLQDRPKGGKD